MRNAQQHFRGRLIHRRCLRTANGQHSFSVRGFQEKVDLLDCGRSNPPAPGVRSLKDAVLLSDVPVTEHFSNA